MVILITSYYLFNDLNVNTQSFSITFEVNDNFIGLALSIYKYNDVLFSALQAVLNLEKNSLKGHLKLRIH